MSTETIEVECSIGTCRVHFTVGNEFGEIEAEYYRAETLNDDNEWQRYKGDEVEEELDTQENRIAAIDSYYN